MDTKRKCVEERLDYMLETFSGSIVDILGRTKLYWISLKEKENLHFVDQSMSHFEYSHELKTSQGKYIQLQFGYANYVLIVWLMSWLVEVSAALKVSSAPNNFKWKTMAKQEAPSAQNELWECFPLLCVPILFQQVVKTKYTALYEKIWLLGDTHDEMMFDIGVKQGCLFSPTLLVANCILNYRLAIGRWHWSTIPISRDNILSHFCSYCSKKWVLWVPPI